MSTHNVQKSIACFQKLDGYSNRREVYVIIIFFFAAIFSVRSMFWIIDLTTWMGLDKVQETAPAMVSFVLIFVVFVIVFIGQIFLLEVLGVKDIRNLTENQLTELTLSENELLQLSKIADCRKWKHRKIFKRVLVDLTSTHTSG